MPPARAKNCVPFAMSLKFFAIPVREPEPAEQALNSFLSRHKVLSIDRRFVDVGSDSFWAIAVDYLLGDFGNRSRHFGSARNRVDYKTVLSPEEFTVFSQLRDCRKDMAQADAVPVYALFTNEQLALMVQRRCRTRSDLEQIEGIGTAKTEKYADRLLQILNTQSGTTGETGNESV